MFKLIFTRVLLHVVKPPVPIQLNLHLPIHRAFKKVQGSTASPQHTFYLHTSHSSSVIRLHIYIHTHTQRERVAHTHTHTKYSASPPHNLLTCPPPSGNRTVFAS